MELHHRVALGTRRVVQFGQHLEHRRHVHRLGHGARQLRIHPRAVGDVGDQPVHPHRVRRDDGEQALLLAQILHAPQRLDGRAHGGQRVLQLVRHVGREALVRVDPRPQRARGGLEVAREDADLVAPLQQVRGHRAAAPPPLPHRSGRARELQHGRGQRRRQIEREEYRQHQRDHEKQQHGGADLDQPRLHVPRVAGEQHEAHGLRPAPRRLGDGDQQPVVGRATDIGLGGAL